jgi:hypothetical protein
MIKPPADLLLPVFTSFYMLSSQLFIETEQTLHTTRLWLSNVGLGMMRVRLLIQERSRLTTDGISA